MNFAQNMIDQLKALAEKPGGINEIIKKFGAPRNASGIWHPTRNGNKAPGRIRKQAWGNRTKPNPARRATKPIGVGWWGHGTSLHGVRHHIPAPWQDEVRALEQRIGLKVKVRDGKCYVGKSNLEMPVNVTLDEATVLLDAHLA